MKKSTGIIGAVAILGAAYLGATWYIGKKAQATISDMVGQANQRLVALLGPDSGRSGLKVEIEDYQRRFFSSDVVYSVRMKDAAGKQVDLRLQDHLQHGPFPLNALRAGTLKPLLAHSTARLVATPATQAWVDSQKGATPLLIETQVGLRGAGRSVWTFFPTELAQEGERLSFSGGTLAMNLSNDYADSHATGEFPSFSYASERDGGKVEVRNIQVDSKTGQEGAGRTRVRTVLKIDALNIGGRPQQAVHIEKMAANLDSLQNGNMLEGSLSYDFGRVAIGSVDLGSITIGGKAAQVDMAALSALAGEYDAIKAKHGVLDDRDLVLTDDEQAVLRAKLQPVLAAQPSLAIDPLIWKNAKGQSRASLHVLLTAAAESQNQDVDIILSQVLKQLRLDLTLSKPMFIQAFGQLQNAASADQRLQMEMLGAMLYDQYVIRLQQAGLVKVDGDSAASAIRYENDGIEVNGTAMSVPEFMQRVLSVAM